MAKGFMKKQSKRIPARQRFKIEKKVREHNRKLKREAKKKQNQNKAPKPIEIPNVCPFKEQILDEVAEYKKKMEEEREKRREMLKEERKNKRDETLNQMRGGLDGLVANAEARGKVHDALAKKTTDTFTVANNLSDGSAKAFCKEFRKVVEAADVILEVVDARDPLGTRCRQVENTVIQANKKLVVVLNKADLVPPENLMQWLKYMRRSFPTVAFKASTQEQSSRLGERRVKGSKKKGKGKKGWVQNHGLSWKKAVKGSPCVGAGPLFSLLSGYCSSGPAGSTVRTSIRVGVVGLPNVGKSSIINSLKRSKACRVGATPGVTKTAQEIIIDSKIRLLDCPGIVFAAGDRSDDSIVLKNATRVDVLADPITPAAAILRRTNKQQMMELYNIPSYSTPDEFLSLHAARMGRLKRGGIPDVRLAACCLIEDWNRGRIKYHTLPPEVDESSSHVSATIVDSIGADFDPAKFEAMETEELAKLGSDVKDNTMLLTSDGVIESARNEEDEMIVESASNAGKGNSSELIADNVSVEVEAKSGKGKSKETKKKTKDPLMVLEGNQKLNKINKLEYKKMKKAKARQEKQANAVAGALGDISLGGADDDYDFNTDFNKDEKD